MSKKGVGTGGACGHDSSGDVSDDGGPGSMEGQKSVDKGGGLAEGGENAERVRRNFQSSFENVNTFLESYLTILSQDHKEGDVFREIITEGEIFVCFQLEIRAFAYRFPTSRTASNCLQWTQRG